MPTILIAIKCPVCGAYMDQGKNEKVMRCPRCWAALWLTNIRYSPWGIERQKKRDILMGKSEDIRIGNFGNGGKKGGGSRSGKKRKKPKRMIRQLYGYDT